MKTIVYLGDEANAAGFRLAGIDARVATAGAEAAEFATAFAEAAVLLLGDRCAAKVPPAILATARLAAQPLVLVLDDSERSATADLIEPIRRLLGFV